MSEPSSPSPLSAFSAAVAELVRGAAPSVVSVKSQHAQSSGFVWRPGLIVAAENALADDGAIEIVAHDGAATQAELVGRDPSSDVALLRVQRADLPQVSPSSQRPDGRRAGARRRRARRRRRGVARDRLLCRPAMAQHARRAHRRADRAQRGFATIERGRACARRRRPRLRHGGVRPETAHPRHPNGDNRPRRGDARRQGQGRARLSGSRPAAGEARRRRPRADGDQRRRQGPGRGGRASSRATSSSRGTARRSAASTISCASWGPTAWGRR